MRKALAKMALVWVSLVVLAAASAQAAYPERPITFIVPYGAGGPLDTVARIVADRMKTSLGQSIVIENVSGASGSIGVQRAMRSAPDGYTVCVGNWPTHVVNGAMFNLTYDLHADFEHVALLTSNPYILMVRKTLPAKDLREVIAYLKANPGGLTLGTAGPGSGQHIGGLYFQKITGTMLRFVPYRAGAIEIIKDLAGGHIDLTFEQAISGLGSVRGGIVKAYAVTTDKRLKAAPDIPSIDEAGAPGVHISTWTGLFAPKGTTKEAVAALSKAAMEALADPAVARRLADLGQAVPPPAEQTAGAFRAFHKAEIEKWWPIIKAGNVKTEPAK
jgi:tripartite-type tricarboxylate transporter receptor subunit TctC